MIQSTRGLFLVAVATLLVGLIVLFPARVAYRLVDPPDVALSGIAGTVWRGNAAAVSASGVALQDVSWRFKPLRLFTGVVAYRIDATPVSGFVEGVVGMGIGGTLMASDLNAALPLALLSSMLRVSGLDGEASVQFDRLKLRDGLPIAASGVLQVSNLVARNLGLEPIGSFRAEFFTQDAGVAASVEDIDAVVDLAGSLQVNEDRSYQFIAQIAPRPETPPSVKRQLQFLGSANDRGQHELRVEGTL